LAIRKGIAFMCFELRFVFIVSDLIRPIALAPVTNPVNTYAGETALVSGWGLTSQRKCADTFNSYNTDKELLLYSQCHVDLI
jgi:hypothetical protein